MKRIRLVGLCLVAVFALSAVVVASASASSATPEFFKCVKAAKVGKTYIGKYTSKECTEASKVETGGKYELVSAAATEFTAGKSKKTVLHAQGLGGKKEVITCKKDKSKGVFEETFIEGLTYTLEGCANEAKLACGSGGKIETTTAALLEWLNEAGPNSAWPRSPSENSNATVKNSKWAAFCSVLPKRPRRA